MSDGYEEEEIEEEMSGSVGMPIPTPTPAPVKPPVKKEKPVLVNNYYLFIMKFI